MQTKAETSKHKGHFFLELLGNVDGPYKKGGKEAEEDEEQGGIVRRVPSLLDKSLSMQNRRDVSV